MSFYNDASLIMLASAGAGKDGKAYSVKPTDGTGDFTFTRGSNLAATRVNADGLIEKGRENLFLRSNNFTSIWSAANLTLTSGETGYDGGNAWKFLPSGRGSTHFLYQSVTGGGIVTFSVYAKAAGYPGLFVYSDQSFAGKYFNVENGTLGDDYGSPIDSSITAVGNGWYRCTVTVSHTSGQFNIFVSPDGVNTFAMAADGTSAILVQDAQMEIGLAATDYIESGASRGKAGLLEDEPRFDYSGGATCPSLLLEPSRTNLIDYSEYITSANNASISYNATESPEGLLNAPIFTATTTDPFVRSSNISITTGTSYAVSFYVKGFGTAIGKTSSTSVTNTGSATFTLTGSWQKITYTGTATQTRTNAQLRIDAPNVGAVVGEQFSVWGMQVEQDATYPTSYIPTYGSSVTRLSEDLKLPSLSSVFNSTGDYTCFFEVGRLSDVTENQFFYMRSPAFNYITLSATTQNRLQVALYDGISSTSSNSDIDAMDAPAKVAVKLEGSTASVFMNGEKRNLNNSNVSPRGFDRYQNNRNHRKYQEVYFPTALSDADCITLTTI